MLEAETRHPCLSVTWMYDKSNDPRIFPTFPFCRLAQLEEEERLAGLSLSGQILSYLGLFLLTVRGDACSCVCVCVLCVCARVRACVCKYIDRYMDRCR